tara:strand:+ start:60 stop:593 length:534 start_codon:yes stop_codon:yes gene_type:complete
MLSQDSACQRLTTKGHSLGLVDEKTFNIYQEKEEQYQEFLTKLKKIKTELNQKTTTGEDLLKRTDLNPAEIIKLLNISPKNQKLFTRAAIEIKYTGYIAKQKREVEGSKKNEKTPIPNDLEYSKIKGLSNEVIERLNKNLPTSLGQASRLEGVTPAAINLIATTIKKNQLLKKAKTH